MSFINLVYHSVIQEVYIHIFIQQLLKWLFVLGSGPKSWDAVVRGHRHQHGVTSTMTCTRFMRSCRESTCMKLEEKRENSFLLIENAG